ncbi:MAG: hypothetical protein BGO96_15630 [Micrococcales bacterium 73-15]|uniref:hypothetical protein n=1 Tax=Salana multivorans TaxID=120377 RepID=UPI00095CC7B7|nr:hypothetical protein [Salana multivorans]OJX94330.1 MAG: hypothetical protein BGO96_15630 [Micrococcales bacterium 73-15]
MSRLLVRGGTVYTDADRFATALLVEDGLVTWIGDDASAQRHVTESPGTDVLDLAGRLLTPAFADAGEPPGTPDDLIHAGVVARVERTPGAELVTAGPDGQVRPPAPGVVAVVDPRTLPASVDLGAWAADGVPLALGTAPGWTLDPWDLLRHALARGLSARAAFLAHTRGAWRAGGRGLPGDGSPARLYVGAPATFVVWEPTELVTQVADTGRSTWSVDARAGLPPLPRLGALDEPGWHGPAADVVQVDGAVAFPDTDATRRAVIPP